MVRSVCEKAVRDRCHSSPVCDILAVMPQRRSPLATALLITLTVAGLVLLIGGAAVATYANSPANQEGNPYSAIGVAVGAEIAILGTLIAAVCITALVVASRRRRRL